MSDYNNPTLVLSGGLCSPLCRSAVHSSSQNMSLGLLVCSYISSDYLANDFRDVDLSIFWKASAVLRSPKKLLASDNNIADGSRAHSTPLFIRKFLVYSSISILRTCRFLWPQHCSSTKNSSVGRCYCIEEQYIGLHDESLTIIHIIE